MGIIVGIITIVAGFLGDALLGVPLNWPNAGAIVAIAVMGGIIFDKMDQNRTGHD